VRPITLDSNIFVSALKFGGKPMTLVDKGISGEVDIAVSEEIIEETLGVLRDKFGWTAGQLADAEETIRMATRVVRPMVTLTVVKADADDDRILECAVESGSEFIISHDNHLLKLKSYDGIEIIKAGAFLHRLEARGQSR
jgi:putative PIN family toxin of toxin-antitoxin system